MTKTEAKPVAESVNALFSNSPDGLREIVRAVMQEMLETEMTDALGAEKGERSAARLGYVAHLSDGNVSCNSARSDPADHASDQLKKELWPKVGEGVNRGRRHIVGVFEPPLLHRRSDMPCPTITLSN